MSQLAVLEIMEVVKCLIGIAVCIGLWHLVKAVQINTSIQELIMATKQEVLDAIAQEKLEVSVKLDAQNTAINDLTAQIQVLKDQIAQGQAVTPQDLDDIVASVHDIFVPTP